MQKVWGFVRENFSFKGLIIVALSLLPSMLMAFFPPKNTAMEIGENITLAAFEIVGRVALIIILLLSKNSFNRKIEIWFILSCVFGLLYYIVWVRYFIGRSYELLYSPLWFVPIPLAVFPIMAFAFVAIWGKNVPLGLTVAVLAIGHIPQSYIHYLTLGN